jgi:hypothetical protein
MNHERLTAERGQQICDENGMTHYRQFDNGRDAAIQYYVYTYAIVADITECGHGERWCYLSLPRARAALAAWNGDGEPDGWHRAPYSGRRRPDGDPAREVVNW